MRVSLGRVIWGTALGLSFLSPSFAAAQITVTLLGTGNPVPGMERFGPSTLIEAGSHKFVVDAGRGALQRLAQTKVQWQDVDGVLLTHLHSDHVVGFADLWLSGWIVKPGRSRPLDVWGPVGTTNMLNGLTQAFAYDIQIRQSDDHAAAEGVRLLPHEIGEGVIFQRDGVTITAITVDHAPVAPAFGYRFDYAGHSVVLSGDTRVSPNLVRHAEGADLLVHEVVLAAALRRSGRDSARVQGVINHHTTAEQAGGVFAQIHPRLAVFSHIGPPDAPVAELLAATRIQYSGRLEVGADLMVIRVGDSIEVVPPK